MGKRVRALRDTSLVFGSFLVASWLAPLAPGWTARIQAVLGVAAVAFISWRALRDGARLENLGIRFDNLPVSVLVFVLVTAAAMSPLLSRRPEDMRALEVPTYFLWAFFQQFVLVACFWRHFRSLAGLSLTKPSTAAAEMRVAGATAAVFALAHAPNLGLMALVLLAEALWLGVFARYRNLMALALVHAMAALWVSHAVVPSWWLPSLNVGLGYWRG